MNNTESIATNKSLQLLRIALILGAVFFCIVALLQMRNTLSLSAHSSQPEGFSTNRAEASATLVSLPIKHIMTRNFTGVNDVVAINLDGRKGDSNGDSDIDMIGASLNDEGFTWWENEDGKGTRWITHTVDIDEDAEFSGTRSLQAADIDNDNYYDIVAAVDGAIVWWENNGSPANGGWTKHTVEGEFNNAWDIYVANMDRDSDMDILGVANNGDVILWENSLGNGSQWEAHTIATTNEFKASMPSIYAADMNSDNYLDVVAASETNGIRWWENNDGTLPNDATPWVTHIVIDDKFTTVTSIYPAQMNQTGNLPDIISTYQKSGRDYIGWWENSGPDASNWGDAHLGEQFDGGKDVHTADLDQDDDMDILAVGTRGVAWWENLDGEGTDWPKDDVDSDFSEVKVVTAADINGDGYPDILAAGGSTIAWWQFVPDAPELDSIDNEDGDGNYEVTWSTDQEIITYTLQEDDNPGFSSPITETTAMQSYPISGQEPGTYYYRVRSENEIGHSSWSTPATATVPYPLYLPIVLKAPPPTPTPTATNTPTVTNTPAATNTPIATLTYTPEPCLTEEVEANNISGHANKICENVLVDGKLIDYYDINNKLKIDRDYYSLKYFKNPTKITFYLDMTNIPHGTVTYGVNVYLGDDIIKSLNNSGGGITNANVELEANQTYFFRVFRNSGNEHPGTYRLKWEVTSP